MKNEEQFKALLELQKADKELRILQAEVAKSTTVKQRDDFSKKFYAAKDALDSCDAEAERIIGILQGAKEYMAENTAKFEELTAPDESDIEAMREYVRAIESLKNKFTAVEGKLNDNLKKASEVLTRYTDAQKSGKLMREKYTAAKTAVEEEMALVQPRIDALTGKIKEYREKTSENMLAVYDALSADKFPPIVTARAAERDAYTCGGCGMSLSKNAISQLKEEGFCKCESCGRIVYVKGGMK